MTSFLHSRPQWPNERPQMAKSDPVPNQPPAADPGGSAAIDVVHLVKLYKTTRAVDDVTFRIARGSITGLLGGNAPARPRRLR
jgi:ABC-2 type transport system ATP-binding protein